MPDGPFKGMARDPESRPDRSKYTVCDRCGAKVYQGDWPWCAGDPKQHDRG